MENEPQEPQEQNEKLEDLDLFQVVINNLRDEIKKAGTGLSDEVLESNYQAEFDLLACGQKYGNQTGKEETVEISRAIDNFRNRNYDRQIYQKPVFRSVDDELGLNSTDFITAFGVIKEMQEAIGSDKVYKRVNLFHEIGHNRVRGNRLNRLLRKLLKVDEQNPFEYYQGDPEITEPPSPPARAISKDVVFSTAIPNLKLKISEDNIGDPAHYQKFGRLEIEEED